MPGRRTVLKSAGSLAGATGVFGTGVFGYAKTVYPGVLRSPPENAIWSAGRWSQCRRASRPTCSGTGRAAAADEGRGTAINGLGIDVGGTKVALRVNDAEETFHWSTGTFRQDLDALGEHVQVLLDRLDGPPDAVGVAVPAICDASGTVRTWPGRPSWVGHNLMAALRELFPTTPVGYADDGDLAALAEADEAGCSDLLYLGVGTGIGGGIVHDGRPWPGPARGSCEVGHLVVDRAGPRCDCGRHGCVQAVASGPATIRRASALRGAEVTFADLVEGTRTGLGWATTAVDESATALAAAATGIRELAHPSLVLVGGGFAAAVPGFVDMIAAHVEASNRPGVTPVPVRSAALGGLSSLRGALLLAEDTARQSHLPRVDRSDTVS